MTVILTIYRRRYSYC